MLGQLLAVALGGALGAGTRFVLGLLASHYCPQQLYWATFFVNILGCFAIGCLWAWFLIRPELSPLLRLGLTVGLLGGFTTFSSFSLETLQLLELGQTTTALLYSLGSVLGGLLATWLGILLVRSYS